MTVETAAPILVAENLQRHYEIPRGMFAKPAILKAVGGASFSADTGDTLAVVGESGCGKSTLARMLTLIEPPTEGTLKIDGIDIAHATADQRRRLRRAVQIVFQNPYGSLNPRQRIGSALEEPLYINTDLPAAERREKARAMLARVGLRPEHYERYPHMFSGGQRQRIAIARALMTNPKLVVLDEPVSALDVSIRAQILNLLDELQHELGLTYVFISHDLSVVRHVADRVLVMYLGKPVEQADVKTLFATPRHPYTQALLSATPVAAPGEKRERIRLTGELPSPIKPPAGCAFNPRCSFATDRCRTEIPLPLPTPEGALVACHGVEEGRI
ncbi:dipeptide ABC transporter ATP-binding protein [Segnochrobactraceae bacterium EtOH-i3]